MTVGLERIPGAAADARLRAGRRARDQRCGREAEPQFPVAEPSFRHAPSRLASPRSVAARPADLSRWKD